MNPGNLDEVVNTTPTDGFPLPIRSTRSSNKWSGWSASIGLPTRLFLTVKKSSSDRVGKRSGSD